MQPVNETDDVDEVSLTKEMAEQMRDDFEDEAIEPKTPPSPAKHEGANDSDKQTQQLSRAVDALANLFFGDLTREKTNFIADKLSDAAGVLEERRKERSMKLDADKRARLSERESMEDAHNDAMRAFDEETAKSERDAMAEISEIDRRVNGLQRCAAGMGGAIEPAPAEKPKDKKAK